ncbi:hypothetical protein AVEN_188706-1 [Araneus ventricosus]|uniref:Transposable element Tcb2 transposase n=1 Tax=Araneus ventricosus TaxID=182803 RepID=A0A4Y2D8H5_ARAVE|nr:hypothetical protein AVEN_188706-1 [Araneus ventricosus]
MSLVSRSVVQMTLGSISIRRLYVQKTCFRLITSYNTGRRPFSSSFGRKEKKHYCAAACCRPLCSIREKNLRYYGAKMPSQCSFLCKATSCVCPPQRATEKGPLMLAREHVSWTRQQWVSVLFTDKSRFTLESDSGHLLIWREQRTRYHQSNTLERHSYRGGGIMVWAKISLSGHTDLHVFHGGTPTGVKYRDEILDPYVRPYAGAIGNDFILMDDNARPHRAVVVEGYLEGHGENLLIVEPLPVFLEPILKAKKKNRKRSRVQRSASNPSVQPSNSSSTSQSIEKHAEGINIKNNGPRQQMHRRSYACENCNPNTCAEIRTSEKDRKSNKTPFQNLTNGTILSSQNPPVKNQRQEKGKDRFSIMKFLKFQRRDSI